MGSHLDLTFGENYRKENRNWLDHLAGTIYLSLKPDLAVLFRFEAPTLGALIAMDGMYAALQEKTVTRIHYFYRRPLSHSLGSS
jgi:hypothetical protein